MNEALITVYEGVIDLLVKSFGLTEEAAKEKLASGNYTLTMQQNEDGSVAFKLKG